MSPRSGDWERLDRLVDRMSETTGQLRFFAGREGEALPGGGLGAEIGYGLRAPAGRGVLTP